MTTLAFSTFLLTHGLLFHMASKGSANGQMTSQSHPLLASVLSVANAVQELDFQAKLLDSKGLMQPSKIFKDIGPKKNFGPSMRILPRLIRGPDAMDLQMPPAVGIQPAAPAVNREIQPGRLQNFLVPLEPQRNTLLDKTKTADPDSQSQFIGPLADMQCSLCQQANNVDCIRRFCWQGSAPTVEIASAAKPIDNRPVRLFPMPEIPVAREVFAGPTQSSPAHSIGLRPGEPSLPLSNTFTGLSQTGLQNNHQVQNLEPRSPLGPPFEILTNSGSQIPNQVDKSISIRSQVLPIAVNDRQTMTPGLANPIDFQGLPETFGVTKVQSNGVNTPDISSRVSGRKGVDLVRNTFVDHPLNSAQDISAFEGPIDSIQIVQLGTNQNRMPQNLDTVSPVQPIQSNSGVDVRRPIESVEVVPLSTNTLRQMVQTAGETRSSTTSQATQGQSRAVQRNPSQTNSRTNIPVANDVFRGQAVSKANLEQHTLVLQSQGNGEETVGIVIGDTQPSHGQLSLFETSGQLPADHPVFTDQATQDLSHSDHSSHSMHIDGHVEHTSVQTERPNLAPSARPNFIPMSSLVGDQQNTDATSHTSNVETLSLSQPQVPSSNLAFNQASDLNTARSMASHRPAEQSSQTQNVINTFNSDMSLDVFSDGFVASILSTTTPVPTMNPARKAELHSWGAHFIPSNI